MLDETHARVRVMIETGANEGYQFKTHPNIDKALYAQSVLGLKDADRPFPTGSPLPILKWRMQVPASPQLQPQAACPQKGVPLQLGPCITTTMIAAIHFFVYCRFMCWPEKTQFPGIRVQCIKEQRGQSEMRCVCVTACLWAAQTKDESLVPLSINCWPSISGGESFVNIEYESFAEFDLQNVVVAIPCHQPPRINQVRCPPPFFGPKASCHLYLDDLCSPGFRETEFQRPRHACHCDVPL